MEEEIRKKRNLDFGFRLEPEQALPGQNTRQAEETTFPFFPFPPSASGDQWAEEKRERRIWDGTVGRYVKSI